jgi:hypothetical protein
MPDSATPLSDCISLCSAQDTVVEDYEHFLRVFLGSQLGVILRGIPPGSSDEHIPGKNELAPAVGITPDGKRMLLACADRAIFVQRFGGPFNAEMDAVALLKTALADPDCEGIMINSAASEHTIVILRDRIVELLARTKTPA